tara:strand:+ start:724 stop:951 length:228 start_codon:yes stop_codon:yes gene_type:complete
MWAVMFEIEGGEWAYDTGKKVFTNYDKTLVFTDKEEAMVQAKKWNTGIVVPWIREFDEEERQASIQREAVNRVHS